MVSQADALTAMPYYGGKRQHLRMILPLLPAARVYVEAFGGSAAVLLNRAKSETEVYNDLYGPAAELMTAIRDRAEELAMAVRLTPYSRRELFAVTRDMLGDSRLETARRLLVRTYQGMLAIPTKSHPGWSRQLSPDKRRGKPKAESFSHAASWRIPAVSERLQGVEILCRPAVEVVAEYDSPDTLFYLDPPYVHETRGGNKEAYGTEMSADDHAELAELLGSVEGRAAVSGYDSPLYDELYPGKRGWLKHMDRSKRLGAATHAGIVRREVLWTNYGATI